MIGGVALFRPFGVQKQKGEGSNHFVLIPQRITRKSIPKAATPKVIHAT
jgi:hypothetical protein